MRILTSDLIIMKSLLSDPRMPVDDIAKESYYHQRLLAIEYTIFKSLGHAGIGSEEMIGQRQEQENHFS